MLSIKRFFTFLILALVIFSSSVLATDVNVMPISNEAEITVEKDDSTSDTATADSIYEDLYIYDTDSYTLSDIVYGNIFGSTTKFVTNPRYNGGIVNGNLFIISNEVIIGSEVTLSDNKDKNGNYIITDIHSKSVINGNVYALSDSFTLEAGSEIHGDLYVASTNVNIEQDAVIDGNIFITASNVNLNGQITGSAYITSDNFDMNYFAYITRDLYLNSQNATLAGVVYRNAFVTVYNKLVTTSYFRVDQNLSVDFANEFTFSGEVKGNATINAKNLSFKNDNSEKCIINGNLNYGTKNEVTIPDGIVLGEVTTSEYVEMNENGFSISNAIFNFFVLLIYVFVIVLLAKRFTPKAIEKLSEINAKNILIGLAIGFASVFAIFILFVFLLLSGVGTYLSLVFVIGYLFVLGLSLPLFLHDIANAIKLKQNVYIKLLLVTIVFYLISLIPTLGSAVVFITLLIGMGRILLGLFSKKE